MHVDKHVTKLNQRRSLCDKIEKNRMKLTIIIRLKFFAINCKILVFIMGKDKHRVCEKKGVI